MSEKNYSVEAAHGCVMTWNLETLEWRVHIDGETLYHIPVTGEELAAKVHAAFFPVLRKALADGRRQGAHEERMKIRHAASVIFSPITAEISNLGAMLESSLRHMPRGGQ